MAVLTALSLRAVASQEQDVRLRKGEAGLPCPSVVNVTQIATVDRGDIVGKLGRLSAQRLQEIRGASGWYSNRRPSNNEKPDGPSK